MTNVAPGATLTATIGTGATSSNANGGTTTLTDGTTTITMTGGTAQDYQNQNQGQDGQCTISPYPGDTVHVKSAPYAAIGQFGVGGQTYFAGHSTNPPAQVQNFVNTGTDGVVILVGV